MTSSPALPPLAFGERFRVESRSGKEYVVRFLHHGELNSGLFVRLDDDKVARVDAHRLRWATYARESDLVGRSVIGPGDDMLVDCAAGSLRGKLASALGDETLQLDNGLRLASREVRALFLMFRAPELRAGDRFFVRSRSGRDYAGKCLDVDGDNARVRLESREEVHLRISSVDPNTLYVAIPVPRDAYL